MSRPALKYRPDIDALRAWAVIAVLLFHLDLTWCQGGFVGVDVFFVISGYLITRNIRVAIEERAFSLMDFYARRVRRLMPSLLVTLTFTGLIGSVLIAPTHLEKLAKNTLGASLSISNIFFWKQTSYFDDALKLNAMTHTWSLSLEEQFYLIYPLLLMWVSTRVKTRSKLIYPFIAFTVGSLVFAIWSTAAKPTFAFFMVPARLWEFTLGGLMWIVEPYLHRGERYRVSSLMLIAGMTMVISSCALISEYDPFPGLLGLIPCLGAALIIAAQPSASGIGSLCAHPLLVRIGKLSYALYLVHWPLIALYRHARFEVELSATAQVGLGVGSFGLAYLLHRVVEQPLRRRVSVWGRFTLVHAMIIAVIIISGVAASVWRSPLGSSDARLTALSIPSGTDLSTFKRATYGGKGCKPPRCSSGEASAQMPQSAVSAFVIGDSYALALHAGIQRYLGTAHVVFWERGACEFYSLNYVGSMNKRPERCVRTKRDAFIELKAHPETPVVLSQHWYANYVEEMRYEPSSPKDVALPIDPPQSFRATSIDEYARFVAHELTQLKERLGVSQLTVVGGPPKFARVFSPLDCYLSPVNPEGCHARPLNAVTRWHQTFQEALITHSRGAFEVIDLYQALCRDEVCAHVTESGELIYSDYGHLSVWGSNAVVSALLTEFKRALGQD